MSKVFGPMGYEVLPFNSLKEAEAFTVSKGGKMVVFDQVTIEKIEPNWKYPIT
jgi:nitrous oxide reductase accessory protein NosL